MTEVEKANQRLKELIPWKHFAQMHSQMITESQLRQLISGRHYNGFGRCVYKISPKRLLIHVPSALEWIESNKD